MSDLATLRRRFGAPLSLQPYVTNPEHLINGGRLIVSVFAVAAIYIDPTQPANLLDEAYWILGGYAFYAFVLLFVRPPAPLEDAFNVITIMVDVLVVAVLIYITGELESPFFVFYTFVLIAAAIRWEWTGTIATALALQAILIFVGVPDVEDGESELNFLILRSVFCWVTVIMLGYFGSYRSRSNARLRELASWPHDIVPEEDRPWLSSSLRHASKVLGADRILVLWRDQDKAAVHAAIWSDESVRFIDHIALSDAALISPGPGSTVELTGGEQRNMLQTLVGTDWHCAYATGFGTIRYRGSVIVIDPAFRDRDVMLLGQIVASRIAMELEQFSLVREYVSAAGLGERVRLARDLHDSVLQDLTAAVLQLNAAERTVSQPTSGTLVQIRDTLQGHQARIRHFIGEARTGSNRKRCLADQLQMFVEPLGSQWDCRVAIRIDPPGLEVSDRVATELCLALSEATANAVRHGAAKEVTIAIQRRSKLLLVTIRDDGSGSNLHGIPRSTSLSDRIENLGGNMAVSLEDLQLCVRMEIPLERAAS
ncbi:ATP-binding protein [Sphingomonas sp. JC676]|uniref:sensor histidine kinase n=1 Tax=Sphingomonas sp. JC676 TaxID=2768065 RepID=UPI001658645A|nr:histidine kinase [Sphingomonas sp. JC676]MBC9031176.1 ATP-binding protein [Sphingomonas sp. JC676]